MKQKTKLTQMKSRHVNDATGSGWETTTTLQGGETTNQQPTREQASKRANEAKRDKANKPLTVAGGGSASRLAAAFMVSEVVLVIAQILLAACFQSVGVSL